MTKICIITGANSGIGFETARGILEAGHEVVMVCRSEERGTQALETLRQETGSDSVSLVLGDLTSFESTRRAAEQILDRWQRIDVLVNNAGGYRNKRLETVDGLEETFHLNHLGPFLFTRLLLERILSDGGGRVVNVSSFAHTMSTVDFDDLFFERKPYAAMGAYGQGKLANVLHAKELVRRYADRGLVAHSLHPGAVRTGFGAAAGGWMKLGFNLVLPFLRTARKAARTPVKLALDPSVAETNGLYWKNEKPTRCSAEAKDAERAVRLWEVSEQLLAEHAAG